MFEKTTFGIRFRPVLTSSLADEEIFHNAALGGALVVVRSTATGDKTGLLWPPHNWSYATLRLEDAVAGSANGKVFVAAFTEDNIGKTALFRFGLTRSGHVTGLRQIPHSVIFGLGHVSLALSPDGIWAAISGLPQTRGIGGAGYYPRGQTKIIVVNTRTGKLKVWQGGLTRPGWELTYPSMSWGSGNSLYVLAQWCRRQVDPGADI